MLQFTNTRLWRLIRNSLVHTIIHNLYMTHKYWIWESSSTISLGVQISHLFSINWFMISINCLGSLLEQKAEVVKNTNSRWSSSSETTMGGRRSSSVYRDIVCLIIFSLLMAINAEDHNGEVGKLSNSYYESQIVSIISIILKLISKSI